MLIYYYSSLVHSPAGEESQVIKTGSYGSLAEGKKDLADKMQLYAFESVFSNLEWFKKVKNSVITGKLIKYDDKRNKSTLVESIIVTIPDDLERYQKSIIESGKEGKISKYVQHFLFSKEKKGLEAL